MKKLFKILPTIFLISLLFASNAYAVTIFTVPQGGTGASTLTGCLTGNGTSPITGSGTCGGTSAAPFNSIQFNNAGAFGGSAIWTIDPTNGSLNVQKDQNDSTQINVINNNNGSSAAAAYAASSDVDNLYFGAFGSGASSYGAISGGDSFFSSSNALVLQTEDSNPIIFATGVSPATEVARFDGDGNFLLKKHSAIGNTAVIDEGGPQSVLLNLQETNTNPNGFQGLTMDSTLYNPSASGGSAIGIQGQMRTMTGNPYNIGTIEGGYFYGWHSGDGNVDNIIGAEMGAFDSDSTAGYNISNFTGSLIQNGHTSTAHVDNGFGQKITTALGAASTMSNYSDLYLAAPTYDASPTIDHLTGLTIEDHSGLGVTDNYNIKSVGGTNWFTGGVAGQSAVNIGNMGGGVLTPTYTVLTQASNLFTDNSGAYVGEFMQTVAKPDDTTVGAQTIGLLFNVFTDAGNSGDWSMYGSSGFVVHNGSGYGQATGAYNFAGNGGAGTASLIGANNVGENDGTSASNSVDDVIGSDNLGINGGFGADHGQWATDMAGTRSTISNGSSARVTRGYGEWILSATGKYGDNYGLYIQDQSGADVSGATYNLFSAGATSKNYFAGLINNNTLTASRVVLSDASKNLISSSVTSTELGYVSGVTSAIQTQLNSKGSGTVTSVSGSGGTTGLTLTGGAITTSGTLTLGGTLAVANGGTGSSSALGIPLIVGNDRKTGLNAAQALATLTVPASDTTYQISTNVNITAVTIASFTVTCTYTDETNTSRSLVLNFSQVSGTLVQTLTAALGAGAYEGVPLEIRAKAGTTISIASSAGGTYTSVTYNLEERILQE